MIKEIEIFQIDAFTKEAFKGNPAAVIFCNDLRDSVKQQIAKEMNLSETAFISNSEKADFKLQWYTPTKEIKLCGHATIASLHFLFEKHLIQQNKKISFETLSGIINCSFENNEYSMQIPVDKISEFTGCKSELLDALDIQTTDVLDLPFLVLDNGYIFIAVCSMNSLWKIKPNFTLLNELSVTKNEFYDVAVFTTDTLESESSAHLRFFAPYHGINEDPVTGSACGPLLLVLRYLKLLKTDLPEIQIKIEQGDILGRSGRVNVNFRAATNELFITGNAVTTLKGKLFI